MIDDGNREGLEIAMGVSLPSRRVVRLLNELVAVHGRPTAVRIDNGPESTAQPFVDWCAEHGVATQYIQPANLIRARTSSASIGATGRRC